MMKTSYYGELASAEVLGGELPQEFSPDQLQGLDSALTQLGGSGHLYGLEGHAGLASEVLQASTKTNDQMRPKVSILVPDRSQKPPASEVHAPLAQLPPARLVSSGHPLAKKLDSDYVQRQLQEKQEKNDEIVNKLTAKRLTDRLQNEASERVSSVQIIQKLQEKQPWLANAASSIARKTKSSFVAPRDGTTKYGSEITKKAKEVAEGGFVGGPIGEKAREARATMVKAVVEQKSLEQRAKTAPASQAGSLQTQANNQLVKAIENRGRVERFRVISTLKLYELMKKADTKTALNQGKTEEAGIHQKLGSAAGKLANSLLTKPLTVPGFGQTASILSQSVSIQDILESRGAPGARIERPISDNKPLSTVLGTSVNAPRSTLPINTSVNPFSREIVSSMSIEGLDSPPNQEINLYRAVSDMVDSTHSAILGRGLALDTGRLLLAASTEVLKAAGGARGGYGLEGLEIGLDPGRVVGQATSAAKEEAKRQAKELVASGQKWVGTQISSLLGSSKTGWSGTLSGTGGGGKLLFNLTGSFTMKEADAGEGQSQFIGQTVLTGEGSVEIANVVLKLAIRVMPDGSLSLIGNKGNNPTHGNDNAYLVGTLTKNSATGTWRAWIEDSSLGTLRNRELSGTWTAKKEATTQTIKESKGAGPGGGAEVPSTGTDAQAATEEGGMPWGTIGLAVAGVATVVGGVLLVRRLRRPLGGIETSELQGCSSCGAAGMEGTPQQQRFSACAGSCKGSGDYRGCMSKCLKRR